MRGYFAMATRRSFQFWRHRSWNGLRKVLFGLTPRGESVWPGVENDLFLAHASIYGFFARSAAGLNVLDAGCGAGYGSGRLGEVAASVLGVDVDPRSVRFATRRYGSENVRFEVANCEALSLPEASFDLVVTSNMLEHLEQPGQFLEAAQGFLRPDGQLMIAVPPITAPELLADNEDNPYHRSNLSVDNWLALFEGHGWRTSLFRHSHPRMYTDLDFSAPWPSRAREDEFVFAPATRDEIYATGTLTAIFVLERSLR